MGMEPRQGDSQPLEAMRGNVAGILSHCARDVFSYPLLDLLLFFLFCSSFFALISEPETFTSGRTYFENSTRGVKIK